MVLTQQRHLRNPDKFPTTQLFLLALVRLAEPIALTSILPYAWKLVLHFHVGSKSDASFYAGILIAAFALAESITGMWWGALSDRVGRKPVLIFGCLGTVLSLLIVGFSLNFWMALFGRFLGGALNGNIGVIQTMVGELVVNPKHEARAYSIMPFVWSIGTILGPCIGGYFATPSETFPEAFSDNGVFAKFPFLLPNLICAALIVLSIIAGYFSIEETHPDLAWGISTQDFAERFQHIRADSSAMATQPTDTTPAFNLTHESYGTFNDVSDEAVEDEWDLKADGTTRTPSMISGTSSGDEYAEKVFTKRVKMLIIALGIFTYHAMTYDHLMPIFFQDDGVPKSGQDGIPVISAVAGNDHGSLAGGLGLSIKDVGFVMSINGLIALFVQGVIFPIMAIRLGVWKLFLVVTILHPIAYSIVPFLTLLPPKLLYPGIFTCLTIRNLLSIVAYPVLLILIKEASPGPSCLGRINGLAASTGAACRTMGSPIAGCLYGIGINAGFTAIAWWASAFVAAIGAAQALMIKRDDDSARQLRVHAAAPFRFMGETPEQRLNRKQSIVRIRVQENDDGYDSEDETTPLARHIV